MHSVDEKCTAASFNQQSKECILRDKTRKGPNKVNGWVSYDFRCKNDTDAGLKEEIAKNKKREGCSMPAAIYTGGLVELLSNIGFSE